jgi:hypothetical protein
MQEKSRKALQTPAAFCFLFVNLEKCRVAGLKQEGDLPPRHTHVFGTKERRDVALGRQKKPFFSTRFAM